MDASPGILICYSLTDNSYKEDRLESKMSVILQQGHLEDICNDGFDHVPIRNIKLVIRLRSQASHVEHDLEFR